MDLGHTKYGLGSTAWAISWMKQDTLEKCPFCEGSGKVHGANEASLNCPSCSGRGHTFRSANSYRLKVKVEGPLTVRQILIEISEPNGRRTFWNPKGDGKIIRYDVLGHSGRGRHTIPEEKLYATKEEAEAQAERLKREGLTKELTELASEAEGEYLGPVED
jgi:hypothetical protein